MSSRLDEFNFISVLGSGAFGKVFKVSELIILTQICIVKAEIRATGEIVAVKQILEDENMMNRETQILQQIKN